MTKFASKLPWGEGGVDWDERINFARMREERLAKAKAAMQKNGVAACILARPENIRYVTSTVSVDFLDQLRYAVAFAEHVHILYQMPPGKLFGVCPWIKPENVRNAIQWGNESCGPAATWEMAKKFAAAIKQDMKERGLEKEKLGVDKLDEPAHQALKEAGIETIDIMPVMLEARAIKTEDEINCLKMVVSIVEAGWYALYQALKPGIRCRDLVAVANEALFRAGAESVWGLTVQAGGSPPNTDKIIQVGDVVTTDFVRVTYLGYCSCYYRNIIVGRKPTDKEKDQHKRSYERTYKVLDAIKPGATTADAAKHWITCQDRGYPSEEYVWCEDLGHGIGLWLYEYPIINRLWSLDYPMTFEKGMTLAVEAMEYSPEIGRTKIEEMIVVTDNGAEIMTRMPVKDIMIASPITVAD
ncbi:Methionine aminopeptidase 1 [subsurface metagenome]